MLREKRGRTGQRLHLHLLQRLHRRLLGNSDATHGRHSWKTGADSVFKMIHRFLTGSTLLPPQMALQRKQRRQYSNRDGHRNRNT